MFDSFTRWPRPPFIDIVYFLFVCDVPQRRCRVEYRRWRREEFAQESCPRRTCANPRRSREISRPRRLKTDMNKQLFVTIRMQIECIYIYIYTLSISLPSSACILLLCLILNLRRVKIDRVVRRYDLLDFVFLNLRPVVDSLRSTGFSC